LNITPVVLFCVGLYLGSKPDSVTILAVCYTSAVEEKLLRNILKDYNRKARPVLKESDVVHISMDIALPQLMKIVSNQIAYSASYVLLLTFFCICIYFVISVGYGNKHILRGPPGESLKARERGVLKIFGNAL